ncbi:MAG: DUF4337 domain-containing protein [Betaproteobacteria bacterium]|nr:DUF4337 domain-containing protein [Betaproteobacteria bacterium]
MSGIGEHIETSNKKIALLIAILALTLAISETLGKAAQTSTLALNIEASNLWSFFQAKTIRATTLRTAAEALDADPVRGSAPEAKAQVEAWKKTAARYDSEPETGEGRRELSQRAKEAEARRDHALAAYHQFELASGAVQIAIVLASATIITGANALAWLAGALGATGVLFTLMGLFAPTAVHLF